MPPWRADERAPRGWSRGAGQGAAIAPQPPPLYRAQQVLVHGELGIDLGKASEKGLRSTWHPRHAGSQRSRSGRTDAAPDALRVATRMAPTLNRVIACCTSLAPPVSRIECMESCGQPTSARAPFLRRRTAGRIGGRERARGQWRPPCRATHRWSASRARWTGWDQWCCRRPRRCARQTPAGAHPSLPVAAAASVGGVSARTATRATRWRACLQGHVGALGDGPQDGRGSGRRGIALICVLLDHDASVHARTMVVLVLGPGGDRGPRGGASAFPVER